MAAATGGAPPDLTGIGAIITAFVAVLVFAVSLFRKGSSDEDADALKNAVLEIREQALEGHDADYDAQVDRVRQLERYIRHHNLPVPPRGADDRH